MIHADISSGILDQVLKEFLEALQRDYVKIESLAKGLFYYLACCHVFLKYGCTVRRPSRAPSPKLERHQPQLCSAIYQYAAADWR